MILEFDYLKKFKCTSYDCINTCCSGWDIHVDEKTFSKIQNSKDPKIENFFLNKLKKSNNKNFAAEINTNKNKRCIFLDNKNLCKIQKNIDDRFLSETCKTYPRREVAFPDSKFFSATFGCPEIINLVLFNNDNPYVLHNGTKSNNNEIGIFKKIDCKYAGTGKKILNFIYNLFLKNENVKFILIVVNQIIIQRHLIEENSSKVDEILNYIYDSLKKENYNKITDDYFQIECLKQIIYQLNNVTEPIAKIINKDCKKFFSKKKSLEDFSNKKKFFDEILNEHPKLESNFFMNEIFGRLQFFTNKDLDAEKMLTKTIITYSLARFFFIITSNEATVSKKNNYSKILSHCSRCFEGMNLEGFSEQKKGFFTSLVALF